MSKQHNSNTLNTLQHGLAGAGAGAVSSFITCPLDVVKTVLQVQTRSHGQQRYNGIIGTAQTILKEEGVRGLYKGLGTTLTALIPNWAIYFYAYNASKEFALNQGFSDGPLVHMTTAMNAAAITDIVTMPLWMIKTRMQTQRMVPSTKIKYRSTWHAFEVITREEGFLALWKGLLPQLIGISHVAVQFPLYEALKNYYAKKGNKTKNDLTPYELVMSSAGSKVTASIAAYPHEVLRARFQYQHSLDPNRYMSIGDAVRRILAEEGIRGFYKGIGANLLRVTPSCAITFTTYELLVRFMNPHPET